MHQFAGPGRDRGVCRIDRGAQHQAGQIVHRLARVDAFGALEPAIKFFGHYLGQGMRAEALEPAHQRANYRGGKIDAAAIAPTAVGSFEADHDAFDGIDLLALPLQHGPKFRNRHDEENPR